MLVLTFRFNAKRENVFLILRQYKSHYEAWTSHFEIMHQALGKHKEMFATKRDQFLSPH